MYEFIDFNGLSTDVVKDLKSGLESQPKSIPGYFIYDKRGSKLFDRICNLPEYYLTRAELNILRNFVDEIIEPYKGHDILVELGSGNLSKTDLLLKAFLKYRWKISFVPIDISGEVLRESSRRLYKAFPGIDVTAFCGEYFDCLKHLGRFGGRKLVLWLGSSVGNFSKQDAAEFLRRLKGILQKGDGLLIGIDLKKDPGTVEKAYNDGEGVTSEYHLNVLHRLNREFGADFNVMEFYHRSFYDCDRGAVEAFIISRRDQRVRIRGLDLDIILQKGEKIFSELSCKYDMAEIEALAGHAGFSLGGKWFDENEGFTLVLFNAI